MTESTHQFTTLTNTLALLFIISWVGCRAEPELERRIKTFEHHKGQVLTDELMKHLRDAH